MKTTWLTQGSFLFEEGRTRILVDPYMSDFLEREKGMTRLAAFPMTLEELRPDWLFCTHDHLDHLDPETVVAIAAAYPDCRMAGPASCYRHFLKLGIPEDRCHCMAPGETLICGEMDITAVTAFHSDADAIGLVLALDGRKVYLSADTTFSMELVNSWTQDCAALIICINGRWGNMNSAEALQIVQALQPRLALPMHYGLFAENTADPQPFIDGCRALDIQSFAMAPGQTFDLLSDAGGE